MAMKSIVALLYTTLLVCPLDIFTLHLLEDLDPPLFSTHIQLLLTCTL